MTTRNINVILDLDSPNFSPCQLLVANIILRAIRDGRYERERKSVKRWMASDNEAPGSFLWCLGALDWPESKKARILELMRNVEVLDLAAK